MNGKEVIKILQKNGWVIARIRGSHHILEDKNQKIVTVPLHGSKDLSRGLLHNIQKQTGVKFS